MVFVCGIKVIHTGHLLGFRHASQILAFIYCYKVKLGYIYAENNANYSFISREIVSKQDPVAPHGYITDATFIFQIKYVVIHREYCSSLLKINFFVKIFSKFYEKQVLDFKTEFSVRKVGDFSPPSPLTLRPMTKSLV